jgi:FG-GAP repeat
MVTFAPEMRATRQAGRGSIHGLRGRLRSLAANLRAAHRCECLTSLAARVLNHPAHADPAWHVVGAGDFNGDGKSDVLWQNDNGQVYEWQMNGMSVAGAGSVGSNTGPAWHIPGQT